MLRNNGGETADALRIIDGVLASHLSHWNKSVAYATRGAILCKRGGYAEALEMYRLSARVPGGDANSALNWYVQALRLGAQSEVRDSIAVIRDREFDPSMKVIDYLTFLRAHVRDGDWTPSPSSRGIVSRSLDTLPAPAREITNVLVKS